MKIKEFNLQAIKEYGAYYPGVFIIKIEKVLQEDGNYDSFDTEDWQTFVHEYVHYLQDISTVHGYLYYQFKAQLLKIAVHTIKSNASDDIMLPIQMEYTGIKNASGKEMVLDFYNKDYTFICFHHINCIKCENDELARELIVEENDFPGDFESVNIYYDDCSTPYRFGNECIIESMAYLVEHHLFGAKKRNREFPYNACEVICEKICPELLETPDRIVRLAELSLMYQDSGTMFYRLVNHCEKYGLWNAVDDDFSDFCKNSSESVNKQFKIAYKHAIDGIDVLFPMAFPEAQMTNLQLKVFLECGYNYRQRHRHFISDAFNSKNPLAYFKQLIELFDIPMIIDGKGDYYSKPGTQNMPVADAFLSILTERCDNGCCLQDFCEESKLECFNKKICTNYPWKQSELDIMCPVAMYFVRFGISNKRYQWKYT